MASRRSWFRFLLLKPVRLFILLCIFVALLFWQKTNILDLVSKVMQLLGWGLLLIALALIALLVMVARRRFRSFFIHINQWLGGAVFLMTVWGILAFWGLGGKVGLGIIGYPTSYFIGLLRVLGLAVIGLILVAPRAFLGFCAGSFSFIRWQFKRIVFRLPRLTGKLPFKRAASEDMATPQPVPEKTIPPIPHVAPVEDAPQAEGNLRQVAQEVWKKYGQSAKLVTVDGWRLPPIDILDRVSEVEFGEADNLQRARLIEEALASYGVDAKVVQINAGPTVTQFGIEPGWDRKSKEVRERDKDGNVKIRVEEISKTRVKVERITSLANDLALALAAPSLRIEAPVPGKSVVGVEVPNTISSMVSLRSVIETSAFQKLLVKTKLAVALGKGAGGEAVAGDLTKMPHLLIAGATGSGKTVCLQTIICCLLMHDSPNDVRFVMVDPKRVELTAYNSIPHLAAPVIVDTNKALSALRWLNQEMDGRYRKLASAGARNIEAYNKSRQGAEKLPFLVLIIDELADLMMAGFDEVETIICRLAQLARAVGIHLVVATQRPSVDVVTGLIKANFPTRISFAVTSQVDSRTILDTGGAEKLLGKGDMLYMPTEAAKPKRLQGCFVSDAEMERLVYFWGNQGREVAVQTSELFSPSAKAQASPPDDPLLQMARELVREHEHVSVSFLQRKLRIGYPRAARLMELLQEEAGKSASGDDANPT